MRSAGSETVPPDSTHSFNDASHVATHAPPTSSGYRSRRGSRPVRSATNSTTDDPHLVDDLQVAAHKGRLPAHQLHPGEDLLSPRRDRRSRAGPSRRGSTAADPRRRAGRRVRCAAGRPGRSRPRRRERPVWTRSSGRTCGRPRRPPRRCPPRWSVRSPARRTGAAQPARALGASRASFVPAASGAWSSVTARTS